MSKNIRTQIGKVIGKTLNSYHARVKPVIDDIKFKEQYQGRIIDCMVGEVDDNYIETPETDAPIVKLEHSKEGLVKVPSIKGKTILVDSDGNETDTPAEGCRLVSVGEDEDNKLIILSKNKNLINLTDDDWIKGYYMDENENMIPWNGFYTTSNYIDISPLSGEQIYFEMKDSGNIKVTEYDVNKVKINYNTSPSYAITFKSSKATKYIKISLSCNILNSHNAMLCKEGDRTFVSHKSHKTEILLDEPLRSLPNGVCDERVGNKLIRRVGKFTIDGTQQIHVWNNSTGDTVNGYLYYHYFKNLTNVKNYGCVFNAILPSNQGGHIATKEGIRITNYVAFSIHKDKLGIEDVNDYVRNQKIVTQWFTENPTEVLYEYNEPIIEELPNGITLQGYDDTTMYIENSLTPTVSYGYNALIPYKEELRTQKEEVETNTLDIENNIIPYLMDMEFNLMLMEDNE